jgi:hypothetical protein
VKRRRRRRGGGGGGEEGEEGGYGVSPEVSSIERVAASSPITHHFSLITHGSRLTFRMALKATSYSCLAFSLMILASSSV